MLADSIERSLEASIVDRFQQVVDRSRLECLDGVLIISRDEYQHGQRLMRNVGQHLESRHARHLDVEKHQVGVIGGDGGEGLTAIRTLRDDLEIASLVQSQLDTAS